MDSNKKVLELCKNYKMIIDTNFIEGDTLSLGLVKVYKDFIFKINIENGDEIKKAKNLDEAMGKYVSDYFFRKTVQEEILKVKFLKTKNALESIVDAINEIYNRYQSNSTRKIYMAKWI